MAEPILVVHGVANRNQDEFETQVKNLNERVGTVFNFIPVYWGDLGAAVGGIADTLPTIPGIVPNLFDDLLCGPSGPVTVKATTIDPKTIVIAAARGALASTSGGLRSLTQPQSTDVALAIRQAWDSTKFLKTIKDEATLRRIGAAVGNAAVTYSYGQRASSYLVSGVAINLNGFAGSVIGAIDDALGSALGNVAGAFVQYLREQFDPGIGLFLGDLLVYQRHRDTIQGRIKAALPPGLGTDNSHPISAIGHSLGGVALFDYAVSDSNPLWIKSLVTFGSQSSFFHVIDPRSTKVNPYRGAPVRLPPTIRGWTNLWEPMDPLAFIAAKIFVLNSGPAPSDLEVDHTFNAGLWTHSAYWTNAQVEGQIRTALR
jgi:hypothetical protein